MRVKVVTDSTSVVPAPLALDLGLTSVPVWVHFEDRSFRDGVDVDVDELYRRLERGERATTSSPSPGDFVAAFETAASDGYGAVFVTTVSSRLSAIHDAARAALGVFTALPVRVFDSGSAVTGAGMVAIEAARAAADGGGLEAVEGVARRVAGRVQVVGIVDTLRFLHRSGRVGAAKYWAGTAAGVRPMFRLTEGKVSRAGLPRSLSTGMARLVRLVGLGEGPVHVGIFHASAPERAEEMRVRLTAAVPRIAETFVSSFSSAMGAHTGPGVVGVGWWYS
jgi:DegV family protein with EDD domain